MGEDEANWLLADRNYITKYFITSLLNKSNAKSIAIQKSEVTLIKNKQSISRSKI